jgi:hypothetical protein
MTVVDSHGQTAGSIIPDAPIFPIPPIHFIAAVAFLVWLAIEPKETIEAFARAWRIQG